MILLGYFVYLKKITVKDTVESDSAVSLTPLSQRIEKALGGGGGILYVWHDYKNFCSV